MAKKTISNIQLGAFVLAGLVFLVVLLYMIGKNRNLFGSNFVLKARFENVQGLVAGNNVKFAGIQAGTVKAISLINDTLIEVSMVIDRKLKRVIHNNAVVSVGTEGLVGNKVLNITPVKMPAPLVQENDVLPARKAVNTQDMLATLYNTNSDVAGIAAGLKETIERMNRSKALWTLLNDETLPKNLSASLAAIKATSGKAFQTASELEEILSDVRNGKGSAGAILRDTVLAANMNRAVLAIAEAGAQADSVARRLDALVATIHRQAINGKGTVNALLSDSSVALKIRLSLENIRKGTEGFNDNMDALKHSFLFRAYFRRLERQRAKKE